MTATDSKSSPLTPAQFYQLQSLGITLYTPRDVDIATQETVKPSLMLSLEQLKQSQIVQDVCLCLGVKVDEVKLSDTQTQSVSFAVGDYIWCFEVNNQAISFDNKRLVSGDLASLQDVASKRLLWSLLAD